MVIFAHMAHNVLYMAPILLVLLLLAAGAIRDGRRADRSRHPD